MVVSAIASTPQFLADASPAYRGTLSAASVRIPRVGDDIF